MFLNYVGYGSSAEGVAYLDLRLKKAGLRDQVRIAAQIGETGPAGLTGGAIVCTGPDQVVAEIALHLGAFQKMSEACQIRRADLVISEALVGQAGVFAHLNACATAPASVT